MTSLSVLPVDDLKEVRERANYIRSLLDPEWRYTRARALKSEGVKFFRNEEDRWVVLLTRFLTRYSKATEEERSDIEYNFPDINWAYTIYVSEYRGPRYHLEALVVSSMPVDEIANYLGLPMAVVSAYENCFFDLRRHLDQEGAIRTYISSRARARKLRDLDPDTFWKLIALAEGSQFLFSLWGEGILEESELSKFDELLASQARRNAAAAMKVRDINAINAHDIIEEYLAMRKIEIDGKRVEAESGADAGTVPGFVASLLHAVRFSVAPINEGSENSYVELTAALAQGPAILRRLQGAAAETEHVEVPEQNGE